MQGWWFVSLLEDTGNEEDTGEEKVAGQHFRDLLESTLRLWTDRAVLEDRRWWVFGPDTGNLSELRSEEAGESLLGFYKDQSAEAYAPQDQTVQNVLLVGDASSDLTRRLFAPAAQGLRLSWGASFPHRTLRIHGLLFSPLKPDASLLPLLAMLATQEAEQVVAYRVWDFLSILQGKNQTTGHACGYPALTSAEDRAALVAACAFHLALGQNDTLQQLARTNPGPTGMGACGLFLDWERLRSAKAGELANRLAGRLGTKAPPAGQNAAAAQSLSQDLAGKWTPSLLMKRLVDHPKRPRFFFPLEIWQQAKDEKGRLVSPWAIARRALLHAYFQRHLHTLPFRVSEYAKVFRQASLQAFQDFLDTWKEGVLNGGEDGEGLLPAVGGQVGRILQGEGGPQSLAQVVAFCEAVEASAAQEQAGVVAESGASEIFDIDHQLRPFYERARRFLSHDQEKALYEKLVDGIRTHPLPGALLLRAAVMGVVVAAGTPLMLALFRPLLPGLRHLAPHVGWIALLVGLLPMCAAVLEYHFWVLKDLRKRLYEYIAAVVRHIQEEAGLRGQKAIQEIRAGVAAYAKEIRGRAEGLSLSWPKPPEGVFKETLFLRELFSLHRIPPHGSECKVLPPSLSVSTSAGSIGLDTVGDQDLDRLLSALFEDETSVPQRLTAYLVGEGGAEDAGTFLGTSLHAFCAKQIPQPVGLQAESQISGHPEIGEFLKNMAWPSVAVDGALQPRWEMKAAFPDGPALLPEATKVKIPRSSITSLAGFMPLDLQRIVEVSGLAGAVVMDMGEAGALVAGWTLVNGHDNEMGLLSPSGEWVTVPEEHLQKAAEARNRLRQSLDRPVSSGAEGSVSAPDELDRDF
jgi:hypothetical protein